MSTSEDKKDESKTKKTNTFWPITIAILICVTLLVLAPFIAKWYAFFFLRKDISSLADSGIFGDSFGFANALISAAAFAGVIVSMFLQRKDLELQRESLDVQKDELKRNTEELSMQRKEFEEQNQTMKLQRFENTFFNMLSLQHEIVSSLKFSNRGSDGDSEVYGRDVFNALFEKHHLKEVNILMANKPMERQSASVGVKTRIAYYGINSYKNIEEVKVLDHYFLHLYSIVKFIQNSNILSSISEKRSYTDMLMATLSNSELLFLFYTAYFKPHFKLLIEEYSMFRNLDKNTLIVSKMRTPEAPHDTLYKESAYDPYVM